MRYKVKVADLQTGMYVTELDRSWVGTPFLFQGFLIESDEELGQIKSLCTFVIIDDAQSTVPVAQVAQPADGAAAAAGKPDASALKLAEHGSQPVTAVRTAAQAHIGGLFDSAGQGDDLRDKIRESQALVQRLVRQSANPNLMMQLVNLRSAQDRNATHALHTAILAIAFGRHLGHSEERLSLLGLGAILHDIGKLHVPAAILNKPGKLTDAEFDVMKRHPLEGYNILKTVDGVPVEVLDMVRFHHERVDGSGYPQGIKGEELPQSASIIALADTYETLTTPNPYALPLTPVAALQQMRSTGTSGFGQDLLQQFMRFMGIYPIGSLVKLNNNDIAVVYASEAHQRLRPIIIIVQDGQGRPVYPHRVINLATLPTEKLSIAEVVDPMHHKMIVPRVFEQELRQSV